jgi:hypothetical protein
LVYNVYYLTNCTVSVILIPTELYFRLKKPLALAFTCTSLRIHWLWWYLHRPSRFSVFIGNYSQTVSEFETDKFVPVDLCSFGIVLVRLSVCKSWSHVAECCNFAAHSCLGTRWRWVLGISNCQKFVLTIFVI